MSTEKILEQFEAAYLRGDFYAAEQDSEIKFQDFRKHCAYVAFKAGWIASRAAIEVELPEIKGFEGAYDSYKQNEFVPFMTDVDDADEIFGLMRGIEVREAIESLGLKVKPC